MFPPGKNRTLVRGRIDPQACVPTHSALSQGGDTMTAIRCTAGLLPSPRRQASSAEAEQGAELHRADQANAQTCCQRPHLWYSDLKPSRTGVQVNDWCVCCGQPRGSRRL